MARIWPALVLLILLAVHGPAGASFSVTVLAADENFSDLLGQELAQRDIGQAEPGDGDMVVAVGGEAFRRALKGNRPVVAVDVPRAELLGAWRRGCSCTGLFREMDPALQLRLVSRLLPTASRVGLLLGPESRWAGSYLPGYADHLGLSLETRRVEDRDELGVALARLLPRVDLLLAVADSELYSPATARLVLLTGYRQNRPVVGPDAAFVEAGSVASMYYPREDLAAQVVQWLASFRDEGRLPAPAFPAAVSVAVNERVAKTFELPVDTSGVLRRELEVRR